MRDGVRRQMAGLLARTAAAIDDKDRLLTPAEHRALASTLIALADRVDAAIASERVHAGAAESYEHRLARAYQEAGLPVPGRMARMLAGEANASPPNTPLPSIPHAAGRGAERDPRKNPEDPLETELYE